jgi:hypothetical protein
MVIAYLRIAKRAEPQNPGSIPKALSFTSEQRRGVMQHKVTAFAVFISLLACTAIPGFAQQPSPSPQRDRIPTQAQQSPDEPRDEDDMGYGWTGHRGMMGQGSTMSEGRLMRHGWMGQHHGMMNPVMMRMIFALMDADGDGTVSLQEWQAAHERIFKAMDVDKDGTVSFEEMMNFMHGSGRPQRARSAR